MSGLAHAGTLFCTSPRSDFIHISDGHLLLTADIVSATSLRRVNFAVEPNSRLGSFTARVITGELVKENLVFELQPDYWCNYKLSIPADFASRTESFPLALTAKCEQRRPSQHRLNCSIR